MFWSLNKGMLIETFRWRRALMLVAMLVAILVAMLAADHALVRKKDWFHLAISWIYSMKWKTKVTRSKPLKGRDGEQCFSLLKQFHFFPSNAHVCFHSCKMSKKFIIVAICVRMSRSTFNHVSYAFRAPKTIFFWPPHLFPTVGTESNWSAFKLT